MGLMERHHYGMRTFKSLNPQPYYNYSGNYLTIIFPLGNANYLEAARLAYNDTDLTKNDIDLLEFIRSKGTVSTQEISNAFDIAYRTAMYRLKKLVDKGLIEIERATNSTKGTKYKLK